jgi:Aconitase C-terminal domain
MSRRKSFRLGCENFSFLTSHCTIVDWLNPPREQSKCACDCTGVIEGPNRRRDVARFHGAERQTVDAKPRRFELRDSGACGSSREQAATALKFKGIPCVIAGSFSETYKRNAFNNGFVVFECPELVTHLRDTLTDRAPTAVGPEITIDYAKSVLTVDGKSFPFPPLSRAARELIVAGGAERVVASRLRARA